MADQKRLDELQRKSQEGNISPTEQQELDRMNAEDGSKSTQNPSQTR